MFHPRPSHRLSPSLTLRPSTDRSPTKFCENGRAFVTDPSTGQPVCLCQLDSHSAHSLQTHPALRGLRAFPGTRPTVGDLHNYQSQLSTLTPISDHTNGLVAGHVPFHPYGHMYAGLDVNGGPVRKAATRETTGPLKVWLSEHKKNPYPTKAEKIMLAIITRMTLTQVSTWFANARRRLKKDNRLSPDGGEEDNVGPDSDREGDRDSLSVGAPLDVDRDVKTALRTDAPLSSEGEPDSFSDISEDENEVFRPESCDNIKAAFGTKVALPTSSSQPSKSDTASPSSLEKTDKSCHLPDTTNVETPKPKPKIWSISHILDS